MALDRTDITPTDDDGTLTVGTVFNAAWWALVYDEIDVALASVPSTPVSVANGGTGATTLTDDGVLYGNGTGAIGATAVGTAGQVLTSNGSGVAPTFQAAAGGSWSVPAASTDTGAQNNWAPGLSGNTFVRWNGASDVAITGIAGGVTGQIVTVKNITAAKVATFAHNSGSSSAGNKFKNIVTSGVTPIASGGFITFQYDGTDWQIVAHNQGSWITPTYAGGDYTASSGTWTVDSGDVTTMKYFLSGRQLTVIFKLETTSVSATPFALRFAAFGYTLTSSLAGSFVYFEGGAWGVGALIITAAATTLTLAKDGGGVATWTTETNAKTVEGSCSVEIT